MPNSIIYFNFILVFISVYKIVSPDKSQVSTLSLRTCLIFDGLFLINTMISFKWMVLISYNLLWWSCFCCCNINHRCRQLQIIGGTRTSHYEVLSDLPQKNLGILKQLSRSCSSLLNSTIISLFLGLWNWYFRTVINETAYKR